MIGLELLATEPAVVTGGLDLQSILAVIFALLAAWKAWQKGKAAEAAKAEGERATSLSLVAQALIVGYEAAKSHVPKATGDMMDSKITRATTALGVEGIVRPLVQQLTQSKKAVDAEGNPITHSAIPAVDANGNAILPKLAILLALCLFPLGCLKAAVHESALSLERDFNVYESCVVPNPRYTYTGDPAFDAQAIAKIKALGDRIKAHTKELVEASK